MSKLLETVGGAGRAAAVREVAVSYRRPEAGWEGETRVLDHQEISCSYWLDTLGVSPLSSSSKRGGEDDSRASEWCSDSAAHGSTLLAGLGELA